MQTFWQGERPGRDLYFICHLTFFGTSLLVKDQNFAAVKFQYMGMGSKGKRKHRQTEAHGRAAKHKQSSCRIDFTLLSSQPCNKPEEGYLVIEHWPGISEFSSQVFNEVSDSVVILKIYRGK